MPTGRQPNPIANQRKHNELLAEIKHGWMVNHHPPTVRDLCYILEKSSGYVTFHIEKMRKEGLLDDKIRILTPTDIQISFGERNDPKD